MGDLNQIPLEEVLAKGLAEAKELFEQDSYLLAGYTLFLIQTRYRAEGQRAPKEVEELQERVECHIRDIYPQRIREAIDQKKYPEAMRLFLAVASHYNKKQQKLPSNLFHLKEQIEGNIDNSLFAETYPRRRFED